MSDHSLAEIAGTPDKDRDKTVAYTVLYDGQCEICQACVAWLKTLDTESRTVCLPISADVLSTVDSRLEISDCLRQLHVVTPEGKAPPSDDEVRRFVSEQRRS